jgi:hypothetical protein
MTHVVLLLYCYKPGIKSSTKKGPDCDYDKSWSFVVTNDIGYRHHDLVNRYGVSVSQMTSDIATMTWLTVAISDVICDTDTP